MKKLLGLILFILIVTAPNSVSGTGAIVAQINHKKLTLSDFNKQFEYNKKFFQYKTPSKKAVLDDLIKRELGIQEAKKLKLHKDPSVIERMNTILYQALIEKALGKKVEKIQVTDLETKKSYIKNPEIRTSHVFIGLPPNPTKAQEKEALKRIKAIQGKFKTMSFAEVAQKFSEGVSAPVGGDIDYQPKSVLDPAFYNAAKRLRVGQVSSPVRTQVGFHLIKLTGTRKWSETDKAKAKRELFAIKRQKLFDDYMGQLRKKSKVVVNSKLLK